MDFLTFNLERFLQYDEKWSHAMGYFNPYIDPFTDHLSPKLPIIDKDAFDKYKKHQWVYDKLLVCKSQGIMCGRLEDLKGRENNISFYPIFIKPRWGHKSAASKYCYKIKSKDELSKYMHLKNMMWSEFIDDTEGMTDFVLLNGKIVYQLTYKYSDKQNGFSDVWKYISSENKPPTKITNWVQSNMSGYTGVVNVQYRRDVIIEVGLRFARGGAYIKSTKNKALIKNINNVIEKNVWDYSLDNQLDFKPFYAFKCYTTSNILYLVPQSIVDLFLDFYHVMPFYEYYFEPVGNDGMVFFQFMHTDFETGMKLKNMIEFYFTGIQYFFIFSIIVLAYILTKDTQYGLILLIFFVILFMTRFLNPICVNNGLYKAVKLKNTTQSPLGPDEISVQ